MAIASLVLGVVSIIGFFVYGLVSVVCGPLAIYFARRAQAMEMRREAPRSSASMAQAGRVCGFVGTALGAVFLAVGVALFIAFLLGVRHRGLPWPIPFP
jgi:sulfite exporter TauE/SafE